MIRTLKSESLKDNYFTHICSWFSTPICFQKL